MKFNIGDKIRFLNEKGEGIITRIINKSTVGVMIEDGFEIPFVVSELVGIYDDSQQKMVIRQEKAEEPAAVYVSAAPTRRETPKAIYLAISPENIKNLAYSGFNLWLVNHTEYAIMFSVSALKGKGHELLDRGEAKPFEAKLLETIDKKEIDLLGTLKADILFFNEKPFEHQAPISETIKIKPFKFYKENAFAENDLVPEKAMIMTISDLSRDLFFNRPESADMDLSKLLFQKKANSTHKISRPHRNNDPSFEMEIDLHIEELSDNYGGMSNAEIVQLQLRHFQKALDKAINEHYRSLTVIHGVGNGRLKQEVRNILTSMNIRFYDGSYAKYGFGATEAVLS